MARKSSTGVRPIGVREVADHAGVSIATVSNVINKPDLVAANTRERVEAAIDELGYVRNVNARLLRTGHSQLLGMIVLELSNPFFAQLATACEVAAEDLGYTVMVGSSDQSRERENRYLATFAEQRVAGMLIAPSVGPTERMRQMHRRGVGMVLFDNNADVRDFCTVAMDGAVGGEMAADHLIDTGRRRLAFLSGSLYLLEERWHGAMRAVQANPGVTLERLRTVGYGMAAGAAAGRALAARDREDWPDAVIAGTDQLAIGLMQGMLAAGVDVPHEIAVVGYDDIEYAATAIVPLTTIRQPVAEIARESLRLIMAENPTKGHVHEHVKPRPELVVRSSTPRVESGRNGRGPSL